ncbi:MAG: M64 family metallopeptidase [Dokdonella sp.]
MTTASGGITYSVTGSIADATRPSLVRAFNAADGSFVVSTEQDWATQRFQLPLAAGTYILEYDDNLENIDSPFFYQKPTRSLPIRVDADMQLPAATRDHAAGEFSLLARVPCALVAANNYLQGWIEVWAKSADGAHIERQAKLDSVSTQGLDGLCEARYVIQLSPGSYTVAASPLGWEPRRFEDVQVIVGERVERAETFAAADRTLVWRGVVVDASHQPVGNAFTLADDRIQGAAWAPWPDAMGRFEIPYRKNWVVDFEQPWWTATESFVRHVVAMDEIPLPSTVVIDDLELESVMDGGLMRLYGNGDREKRFNILFIAEGYTDVAEPFTDANGNGTWDGFVWDDLDKDGVYSSADRLQRYGDYSSMPDPELGSVPTARNEPFTDLNADGVPSLDDPALFLIKARDFMRSFLGSDFWSEHRDAFNAYAMFEPSAQAGYSIYSATGEPLVSRSTRYGASLDQSRNLVSVDRPAAMEKALAVLPEVDLVVVLVNEPVWNGARGNVTVSQPGSMVYMGAGYDRVLRDMTPSHEMGHFIGSLCDEYSEFNGVNPSNGSTSIWCPNASYSANPADVPWAAWLSTVGPAIPSRNLDESIGVYEGADYYPGGAYRPSYRSTMRDLSPLFNEPSRAALLKAVRTRVESGLATPHSHRAMPLVLSRTRKAEPL